MALIRRHIYSLLFVLNTSLSLQTSKIHWAHSKCHFVCSEMAKKFHFRSNSKSILALFKRFKRNKFPCKVCNLYTFKYKTYKIKWEVTHITIQFQNHVSSSISVSRLKTNMIIIQHISFTIKTLGPSDNAMPLKWQKNLQAYGVGLTHFFQK